MFFTHFDLDRRQNERIIRVNYGFQSIAPWSAVCAASFAEVRLKMCKPESYAIAKCFHRTVSEAPRSGAKINPF